MFLNGILFLILHNDQTRQKCEIVSTEFFKEKDIKDVEDNCRNSIGPLATRPYW